MQFSTKDFANLNERIDWLKLLLPIYDPGDHCIQAFLGTGIAIGFDHVADEPDCYVTPAALTVEADGEGPFRTDVEALLWINRWAMDRFEFDGSDGLDLADGFIADVVLFRLPIGEASVSPCEVTL